MEHTIPPLFTLPPELHDMIFTHAYPSTGHTYIGLKAWSDREDRRHWNDRDNYSKVPWPGHVVNSFLVNKEFFVLASRAYIQNQPWSALKNVYNCWDDRASPQGIVFAYLRNLTIKSDQILPTKNWWSERSGWIFRLPSLRRLTLEVIPEHLTEGIELQPWLDRCTEEQFERKWEGNLETWRRLCKMGIRDIGVEPGLCFGARSEKQDRMWEENVARLGWYLRERLADDADFESSRKGGCPPRASTPWPELDEWCGGFEVRSFRCEKLYHGSSVALTAESVQDPEDDMSSFGDESRHHQTADSECFLPDYDDYFYAQSDVSRTMGCFDSPKLEPARLLEDRNIPDSYHGVEDMLIHQKEEMIDWIRRAKERPALKEGGAEEPELNASVGLLYGRTQFVAPDDSIWSDRSRWFMS